MLGLGRILDSLSSPHRVHDFTDFRQTNFTNLEDNMSIGVALNPFAEQKFENFP